MSIYVVITPVRDEAAYVERTIESMASQTIQPAEWILIDDGSTDATGAILDRWAERVPWIKVLHRPNRGFRLSGAGVMEAFYEGYEFLRTRDWDFLVKLDGDLTFSADYFEKTLLHFQEEPRLGIGGGDVYHIISGKKELEVNPRFHVRGATKVYRRQCWEAIGGLWRGPGWDTIDEVKANHLGWKTESFAELHLIHHRFTGTGDTNWREAVKAGRASYCSGYHPVYLAARCAYRIFQKPYVVGAAGMAWGYVSGYLKRLPQIKDREVIAFVRKQQLARLRGTETIWR